MLALPRRSATACSACSTRSAAQGFAAASQASREQAPERRARWRDPAAAGVAALVSLILFFAYGMADVAGLQRELGGVRLPGPAHPAGGHAAAAPEPAAHGPRGDELDARGRRGASSARARAGASWPGGWPARGLRVVVLEAAAVRSEEPTSPGSSSRPTRTCTGAAARRRRADLNITLQAGAALGGGTTVNWTNCLRTRPGCASSGRRPGSATSPPTPSTPTSTRSGRASASPTPARSPTAPSSACATAPRRSGWALQRRHAQRRPRALRRRQRRPHRLRRPLGGQAVDAAQTYLQDASTRGARIVAGCTADRVLVGPDGRAAGVDRDLDRPRDAGRTPARVDGPRAPVVVVAAGALETPALLLRSGIGGPAVGHGPAPAPDRAAFGGYTEDLRAWWGAPHALLVDEFGSGADADGYGFRSRARSTRPGSSARPSPFTTAAAHKEQMERFRTRRRVPRAHPRPRRAAGSPSTTPARPCVTYALDRPASTSRTIAPRLRGARPAPRGRGRERRRDPGRQAARRGAAATTSSAFVARLRRAAAARRRRAAVHRPPDGQRRMGADPATSVADPRGELHDTPGVWIGDASAFPTASGTNPMISVMALAHRTATTIAARPAPGAPPPPRRPDRSDRHERPSPRVHVREHLYVGGAWVAPSSDHDPRRRQPGHRGGRRAHPARDAGRRRPRGGGRPRRLPGLVARPRSRCARRR